MGMAKRMLEEREHLESLAIKVLCDAGALEECENHGDIYFDGGGDVQDAYKLATARISTGEIDLPDGVTRRDFTDAMKSAYENYYGPDGCWACAKAMGD